MTAEIISIGDELLIGQVINSNQAYIADQLNAIGVSVDKMTTVGDKENAILKAFELSFNAHTIVIVTGGLGPTHDDVTRSAVCSFFNTDLVEDKDALANIRRIFSSRGAELLNINRRQALIPRGCAAIQNVHGTAPGFFFERENKYFIVLPGVPYEMKSMMESYVIPKLREKGSKRVILHKTLRTTGIAESMLSKNIGPTDELFDHNKSLSLAYLPSPLGVRLRLTAKTTTTDEAHRLINEFEFKLRNKIGKYIYGIEDEELEEIIGRILIQQGLTLSVAESCTGGLIADRITNVSGSSQYFERGIVTYSNESKIHELGVPIRSLQKHGAVSREVAEAMAFGIRTKSNTNIGLSTTGIAGPTGGSDEKPVGLIWIGYSDGDETIALRFYFGNDRRRFKERAAQAALELLRRKLLKIE